MSEYSENLQKFLKDKAPQIEAAFKKATAVAMNHTLHHVCGDDGEAYPLIDMLSFEGQTVEKGKEEVELLLDAMLIDVLMAYEGLLDDDQP